MTQCHRDFQMFNQFKRATFILKRIMESEPEHQISLMKFHENIDLYRAKAQLLCLSISIQVFEIKLYIKR